MLLILESQLIKRYGEWNATYLNLGRFVGLHIKVDVTHCLFDQADTVRSLGRWIYHSFGYHSRNLLPEISEFRFSLLLADLQFPFGQNLFDNLRRIGRVECLLQVCCWRSLTLRYIGEDLRDL